MTSWIWKVLIEFDHDLVSRRYKCALVRFNILRPAILGRDRDFVIISLPAKLRDQQSFMCFSTTVLDPRVVWIISIDF